MVRTLIGYAGLALIAGCASSKHHEEWERARDIGLTYLTRHGLPLPHDYSIDVYMPDYASELDHLSPVYELCIGEGSPAQAYASGCYYSVIVNPRSWKVEKFAKKSPRPFSN